MFTIGELPIKSAFLGGSLEFLFKGLTESSRLNILCILTFLFSYPKCIRKLYIYLYLYLVEVDEPMIV